MIKNNQKSKGRATLVDVAVEAGVGQATVDRYLNGRTTVKAKTAEKIRAAMEKLEYRSAQMNKLIAKEAAGAPARQAPRMAFIVPAWQDSIYEHLRVTLLEVFDHHYDFSTEPVIAEYDIQDVTAATRVMEQLSQQVDYIGLVALDDPTIGRAIQQAARQGIKIFTLFSPLSHAGQIAHIGLDDRKAGRSAAWIAQRLMPEPRSLAIFQGNNRFLCQETCEVSFRSYFREKNCAVNYIGPLNTWENLQHAEDETDKLLRDNPGLNLIYAPCGGVRGIIDSVSKQGRKKELFIICHGPFPGWEQALIDEQVDVIIQHDISEMCRLIHSLALDQGQRNDYRYLPVNFEIKIRENI